MDIVESKLAFANRHPWEISRQQSLKNLVNNLSPRKILDVGAGDLYLTESLVDGTREIWAIDHSFESTKVVNSIRRIKNLEEIPSTNFDCLTLFDVVEHIANPKQFIQKLLEKTHFPQWIVATVPAYQFLYGPHDQFLSHCRRYNLPHLLTEFDLNKYQLIEGFYFYTPLFFIRFLQKILKLEKSKQVTNWQYSENSLITRSIVAILNLDFKINRLIAQIGIKLPGLSVCVVLKKKISR